MITNNEVNEIISGFERAELLEVRSPEKAAKFALRAWELLISIMGRENNYSDELGNEDLDWQIKNFAQDISMYLHNAKMYDACIAANQQVLKIKWSQDEKRTYENAMRDIADEYADKGDIEKARSLFAEYLKKDPKWGWAWIDYFRFLKDYDKEQFKPMLDSLYRKIQRKEKFRDAEDLYRELADEYKELGELEKSNELRKLEKIEIKKERKKFMRGF